MRALVLSCLLLLPMSLARAAEPVLEVAVGGETDRHAGCDVGNA